MNDDLIKRLADELGPSASDEELAEAVLDAIENLPDDEKRELVTGMIAREIAVRRFNEAVSALKASVGETSLADALRHAQALVDEDRVRLVEESSPSTVVGHLHIEGELRGTAEIAVNLAAFHRATAELIDVTGQPNLDAVMTLGLDLDLD
jgi:CHAD domain-containing protein